MKGAGLFLALFLGSAFGCGRLSGQVPSEPAAVDSLAAAADRGDTGAQYEYGRMHEVGAGGFSVDYQVAIEWYRRAADQDHVPAMLSLSTLLLRTEPQEAIRLVLRSAELGSAEAQWRAGQVYSGRIFIPLSGVNHDREIALQWFTLAAAQGHSPSLEALADLHTEPDDPSRYSEGAELYLRAADAEGGAWSALRLGMMHAIGEGVVEDQTAAREWLSRLGREYEINSSLFSENDLEFLGGLQDYYGLDFIGGVDSPSDPAAAAEAFRVVLDSSLDGALYRPLIHPSFARTAQALLQVLQN